MHKAVIVIPIYKKELDSGEAASLKQCAKILKDYPIIFVCPKTLDTSNYNNILNQTNANFDFIRFEDSNFKSLNSYSKLMLKPSFYKKFIDYEFMLIYQLDAWVFENSLEYWCEKGYDYIGAPWFSGYELSNENSQMMEVVGNGGFSLRKISAISELLSKQNIFAKIHLHASKLFEDCLIAKYGAKAENFNLAPPEIAMKFSFEAQPKRLYKMNNQKLPFGCHAFEKYDFEFWKEFIK